MNPTLLTLLVVQNQQMGKVLRSRTGREYIVTNVTAKGFELTRRQTGKKVTISNKLLVRTLKRLFAGEELQFQASEKDGGISYTVAIVIGVVGCLQDFIETDHQKRVYRLLSSLKDIDFEDMRDD